MAAPQKYLFDVSFDHVGEAEAEAEAEETFTRTELEAARDTAFAEGRRAALAEAEAAAATKAAAALDALVQGLSGLIAAQDARIADAQRDAIAALRLVVAKVLPALAVRAPLAEIEALTAKCLIEAIDEPRVVLRVGNEVYEPVKLRLDAIAAASGYAGRMVLLADDHLSGADARIEWADGGAERNFRRQLNDIDAAMARLCDPAASPDRALPSA